MHVFDPVDSVTDSIGYRTKLHDDFLGLFLSVQHHRKARVVGIIGTQDGHDMVFNGRALRKIKSPIIMSVFVMWTSNPLPQNLKNKHDIRWL